MRVVKPGWVNHDGKPIFSVDIHPDGSRFATGGQGDDYGKIIIWNMAPVRDQYLEEDEKVPKILCQMDNHYACVNCVRWSHNGKFLASGGDDKLIMIWQTSRGAGPSKAFGSSGSVVIFEQWRPVFTLRGHSGDVLDLSWSPQDVWLATCSVDNSIIVWNALKFPEQISTLKGHTGLVKGVTWDPVGKYLASQSDDRSLRVWRTMDWQQESVVTEPFKECGGTTHTLRLNWSPDGHHIVSAHAMNNSGPTAQIIERQAFQASLDFVGHRKAVTVVRFNPNIFSKSSKGQKSQRYSCCAIGSKDRSVSIWLTCLKRPLVVMHDLFENSILDLSWSQNGLELISCSIDGTIGFLDFSAQEIGHPLTKDEVINLLESVYGKGVSLNVAATKGSQIIESTAMLNLQEQQKHKENSSNVLTPSKNSCTSSQMSASGDNTPFKPLDKQIETRTADGRRRITPIFLAPQPEVGEVPLPFSSNSNIGFHSSSEKSKIVVEKQNRVTVPGLLSPSSGSRSMPSPPQGTLSTVAGGSPAIKELVCSSSVQAQTTKVVNETTPEKQSSKTLITTPPDKPTEKAHLAVPLTKPVIVPDKPLGTEKLEKSPQPVPDKSKTVEKEKDKDKESGNKESQAAKEKLKTKLPSSLNLKRKLADDKRYAKRGRPSKMDQAAREAAMAAAAAEAMGTVLNASVASTPTIAVTTPATPHRSHLHTFSTLELPALTINKFASKVIQGQVGDASSLVVEVENGMELGVAKVHRLRCLQGGKVIWDNMLTSPICAVAGSSHIVCAACADGTVSIFSVRGRRLLPPLVTGAPPAVLSCLRQHLMVITSKGMMFVWDCQLLRAEIKHESLGAIMTATDTLEHAVLTSEGVPVITLDNRKSYSFPIEIGSWVLTHNANDGLEACSNHHHCAPSKLRPLGPLASLQKESRSSLQASRSFQSNSGARQSLTLSHLESQIAASQVLKSGNEYKFWMETYIRYLAQEGAEAKLREVCDELLGPVYKSKASKTWSPLVLGINKHAILRNVLPSIGADLKFQRLYTEYKDQLDMMQGT